MHIPPSIGDTFRQDFVYTNEDVLLYARISGDTNPVHLSDTYAAQTNFKRCIVHGYFSISVFSKIYGTLLYPDGHILISQAAKYIRPIFTDTEYTAVFTTTKLFPDKNRVRYLNEIFEKQTGELKITGEAILVAPY